MTSTPPEMSADATARMMRALEESPTAFGFFQVVRLLSRLHPERARIGRWSDPSNEVARFHASTSLGFPASEIEEMTLPPDYGARSAPAQMTVNFFGLTGPQGVMPHVYTEHASHRARLRDTAFRDFLDIFNHRAISLLFRAWEKNNAIVAHESGAEDRLYDHLLDLAGMGTRGLRNRLPIRDEAVAFFSGLLATRARPADGLARLIGDYFGVATTVEQFIGEWRQLDSGGQCALGLEGEAGRLGFGVIGDAVWDPQARVRLRLGPLTREQFESFIPGGSAHDALKTLARLYADDIVGVDAQLVLTRREVTPCVLDVPGSAPGGRRGPGLGRGTWLASRPLTRDPDETTLRLC
ncbi:MAG: type VI secretion system baseplate subunit TssG [Gemmatimonadota bacterium]